MKTNNTFAVLGLGRYGLAVAKTLISHGVDLIAVDENDAVVQAAAEFIPVCKCADITDIATLKALDIGSVDVVIIAMASQLEETIMAVTLCKELGAKHVIVKSANELHKKILLRVGADEVVIPESESGIRLAKNLIGSNFFESISLSEDISIVDVPIPQAWVGKSLIDLELRKKYNVNVIAVKEGENLVIDINPNKKLDKDTKLVILAHASKIKKLSKDIT